MSTPSKEYFTKKAALEHEMFQIGYKMFELLKSEEAESESVIFRLSKEGRISIDWKAKDRDAHKGTIEYANR